MSAEHLRLPRQYRFEGETKKAHTLGDITMRSEWIIVDGYNLIHQQDNGKELLRRDLFLARQRLIRDLEITIPSLATRITVVFDGTGEHGGFDKFKTSPVEVIFSAQGNTADTVIERMAGEHTRPQDILVVTSDHLETNAVLGSGANTISCSSFLARLNASKTTLSESKYISKSERKLGRLGDKFP